MTKEEKARSIIKQGGECRGVSCCSGEDNECPCYSVCTGGIDKDPRKTAACQNLLDCVALHDSPQPSKTLLDEFAMAAIQGLISITKPAGTNMTTSEIFAELSEQSYSQAAAMMKERARRDESGNVKEVGK